MKFVRSVFVFLLFMLMTVGASAAPYSFSNAGSMPTLYAASSSYRSSSYRSYSSPTRSYSSPSTSSRSSSYKSSSARPKTSSSITPRSSSSAYSNRSYSSPSSTYGFGGLGNTLLTMAVVSAILSDNDANADTGKKEYTAEQKKAVTDQFETCRQKTGYVGTQEEASKLIDRDDLNGTESKFQECFLADQADDGGSNVFVWILATVVGLIAVAIIYAMFVG